MQCLAPSWHQMGLGILPTLLLAVQASQKCGSTTTASNPVHSFVLSGPPSLPSPKASCLERGNPGHELSLWAVLLPGSDTRQ